MMGMEHPFVSFWEQSYGSVPPLNWKLRAGVPDRWLRIHTLPYSKRYAGTQSEAAEIAERQVTTAKAPFEDDAPVWLVTWRYHPPPGATELAYPSEKFGALLVEAGVLDGDAEHETITVLVARLRWSASTSASLRRAIADDEERAMRVHERTAEVFAPYDGGVDLIFSSVERRDQHKQRFSAWLSSRPSGL
jgi:hypothetical protein